LELVALFTASGLLQSLRLPSLTILCAAGHFKQTQVRAIIEAVINLGVSLILIGPFGISGVLLGTCLSYLYRTTDVILYSAKHFLQGSLKTTGGRILRNLSVSGAMIALCIRFVPQQMDGWLMWFVWAVFSGGLSSIVLLAVNLLLEPEEAKALLTRAKELLKR
jgi:O-antigen/teichoic acid export membrane protein